MPCQRFRFKAKARSELGRCGFTEDAAKSALGGNIEGIAADFAVFGEDGAVRCRSILATKRPRRFRVPRSPPWNSLVNFGHLAAGESADRGHGWGYRFSPCNSPMRWAHARSSPPAAMPSSNGRKNSAHRRPSTTRRRPNGAQQRARSPAIPVSITWSKLAGREHYRKPLRRCGMAARSGLSAFWPQGNSIRSPCS